jgi:hypothetical protein
VSGGGTGAARRIAENPLYVLALGAGASRLEVERQAQLLLGMLELGFAEARAYATPIGPQPRTADGVRAAVAQLRDPAGRLAAELWLAEPAEAASGAASSTEAAELAEAEPEPTEAPAPAPFAGALAALGWSRPGGAR